VGGDDRRPIERNQSPDGTVGLDQRRDVGVGNVDRHPASALQIGVRPRSLRDSDQGAWRPRDDEKFHAPQYPAVLRRG